jgi:hypothetical protein
MAKCKKKKASLFIDVVIVIVYCDCFENKKDGYIALYRCAFCLVRRQRRLETGGRLWVHSKGVWDQ